ncbi:MAG TPA: LLM class flavin-dependent oxidoreductase [Acidimicrobiales bacterium]|nr:LLM class flavin-dependent oxidoreductase [Acidimicrobiales bacterium]
MRIGITVAHCDRLASPAAVVAAVKAAEQLGYSSVWVSDSALDPAGVLSAAAAVTTRVGLGAGIVVGANEDPVSLARSLATVDLLSEGRLTVALGGPEQALDPVLDAVAQGPAPVLLDGRTPGVLDRVARRAGGWSPTAVSVEELEPMWSSVQRLAASHGRDPDDLRLVVRPQVALRETPAGAGRASYEGDAEQVAGDVDASHRLGAHEVVLRLGGDLSLDEALDGYARIAEATELHRAAGQRA